MTDTEWKKVADEVERAFRDASVLTKDRQTLERWMVALSIGSFEFMRDQEPMMRRREAIKHLLSVRLTEEAERRREAQSVAAGDSMRRHNRITRWIAIAGIVISALSGIATFFKKSVPIVISSPHTPAPPQSK